MIPAIFGVTAVLGYYLYHYLTYEAEFCGSFAALDDEIGWVLAPNARSCISGRRTASGVPIFTSTVYTNVDGARTNAARPASATGGILAIGDSHTFGFGIDWRHTFAARLTDAHPVALFASPAYSGAQALLLGRRMIDIVKPTHIVYLERGFWGRAVCTGETRPMNILKPCYWVDSEGQAHLVTPPAGHVSRMARAGLRPGGMLGAGEKTLTYFLISRPLAKLKSLLVRLGLRSGFAHDFHPVAPERELDAIKVAHYRNIVGLARDAGAILVLIDAAGIYQAARAASAPARDMVYVTREAWLAEVTVPMAALPPDQALVPGDGHDGPGTHGLIAELIRRRISQR